MKTKMYYFYIGWLIIAALVTPIILLHISKHWLIDTFVTYLSIALSWALFNDNVKQTGAFGVTLAMSYAIIYYVNKTFALFSYELYSVIMFGSLLFKTKYEHNTKNTLFQILIVSIMATIFYFSLNTITKINCKFLLDFLSFLLTMIATLLSSKRSIYQFLFYIPSSMILIILSFIIKEPVLLLTSTIFIICDIQSYLYWRKKED